MVEGLAERLLQGGEFGPGLLELDPQAEVIRSSRRRNCVSRVPMLDPPRFACSRWVLMYSVWIIRRQL
jgi:hypothetical protein